MMLRGFPRNGFTEVLMTSVFFIITVHILAPIRRSRAPNAEKMADTKNVRLFLAIPL